jgi:diaminohydroxyphosphoribosylaminopyrimidine deaminase/5-amino-6-(5-phosphoribosylamino)uracil reductase
MSPYEHAAMRLAVALSALGLGTSPNPPVGCVILDAAGKIVGQGYHHRKGEAHAEVNALTDAGSRAAGGTAVVTLEPCNHHGVTPPCHQALIDAGIRRVVIAVIDPTSRGEGGAARLRQADVDVELGVLEAEAKLVIGPWLTAQARKRPHLVWQTLGTGGEGEFDHLPDAADLRHCVDVVLRADGAAEEAVPGSHGHSALKLAGRSRVAAPAGMVRALYQAGVRLALLDASSAEAAPFFQQELIDRSSSRSS